MTLPRARAGHAWSLGEPGSGIVRDLAKLDPHTIVEFGSGASSVRLALALRPPASTRSRAKDLPRAHAWPAGDRAVGQERLTVTLRPLRVRRIGGAIYETYSEGPFPRSIHAILIDGPPGWPDWARSVLARRSAPPARRRRVYLDDFERNDERRIVRNWTASYQTRSVCRSFRWVTALCARKAIPQSSGTSPSTSSSTLGSLTRVGVCARRPAGSHAPKQRDWAAVTREVVAVSQRSRHVLMPTHAGTYHFCTNRVPLDPTPTSGAIRWSRVTGSYRMTTPKASVIVPMYNASHTSSSNSRRSNHNRFHPMTMRSSGSTMAH